MTDEDKRIIELETEVKMLREMLDYERRQKRQSTPWPYPLGKGVRDSWPPTVGPWTNDNIACGKVSAD